MAYPPLTVALLALSELSCVSAIAAPSSSYRRLHFIPTAVLGYIILRVIDHSGPSAFETYGLAVRVVVQLFNVLDYVLIRDPTKDVRLIGDKTDISKLSLVQRLIWGAKLMYSPRNIGWSHEEPNRLPPRPTQTSRWQFVAAKLRGWIVLVLIHDVNFTLIRMNPQFKDVPPVFDGRVLSDFTWLFWRLHMGIGLLVVIIGSLESFTACVAIVWVSLGLSDYKEWPWMFGSLSDAYTLRRFWSKTWHQLYRRVFLSPTEAIAKAIGLPKTGRFQRYFKLFLVFAFSGILHQIPDGVQVGDWTKPVIYCYFLVQPPMIMLEDAVIALGKRAGIKNSWWTRLVGYTYVIAWFTLISPFWMKTEGPAGNFDGRMEVSLVDGLWRGNWTPYAKVM